jgi:hypothetical protein
MDRLRNSRGGSRDVGLELVQQGYAWHFKHFAKEGDFEQRNHAPIMP